MDCESKRGLKKRIVRRNNPGNERMVTFVTNGFVDVPRCSLRSLIHIDFNLFLELVSDDLCVYWVCVTHFHQMRLVQ